MSRIPPVLLAAASLLWMPAPLGSRDAPGWQAHIRVFEQELQELQAALAIPGLGYAVVADGRVIASRAFGVARTSPVRPFATTTPLRIASVTKAMTAVVALQLVEEGTLDLDAPARRYEPDLQVPAGVTVRHLLTHTSEGEPGVEFVYSTSRYAMLGRILETASAQRFEDALLRRVLQPAAMKVHESPLLGAHTGLTSTTRDLAAFLVALDRGRLLRRESLGSLDIASRSANGAPLPVSLGWFTQRVEGHSVTWSYGQDDPDHSGALLLRVPDQRLSLVVLANANTLNDPFRLLMGDVRKSPFALSFLRVFVHSPPGAPRLRRDRTDVPGGNGRDREVAPAPFLRDEALSWMLVDLWRGRTRSAQERYALARSLGQGEPDPVVHFAAVRMEDVRAKDDAIEAGQRLLAAHPGNRWMLLAQGYLLQQRARDAKAARCFEAVLALPNQEPDDLHRLFMAWSRLALAEMAAESDPDRARALLRDVLGSGVTGEPLEQAERLFRSISARERP